MRLSAILPIIAMAWAPREGALGAVLVLMGAAPHGRAATVQAR